MSNTLQQIILWSYAIIYNTWEHEHYVHVHKQIYTYKNETTGSLWNARWQQTYWVVSFVNVHVVLGMYTLPRRKKKHYFVSLLPISVLISPLFKKKRKLRSLQKHCWRMAIITDWLKISKAINSDKIVCNRVHGPSIQRSQQVISDFKNWKAVQRGRPTRKSVSLILFNYR